MPYKHSRAVDIRVDGPLVVATRPISLRDTRPHSRINTPRAFVRRHRLIEQSAVSARVDQPCEQFGIVGGPRLPEQPHHRALGAPEIGLEIRIQAMRDRQVGVQLERACEGGFFRTVGFRQAIAFRICRSLGRPVPAAPRPEVTRILMNRLPDFQVARGVQKCRAS